MDMCAHLRKKKGKTVNLPSIVLQKTICILNYYIQNRLTVPHKNLIVPVLYRIFSKFQAKFLKLIPYTKKYIKNSYFVLNVSVYASSLFTLCKQLFHNDLNYFFRGFYQGIHSKIYRRQQGVQWHLRFRCLIE